MRRVDALLGIRGLIMRGFTGKAVAIGFLVVSGSALLTSCATPNEPPIPTWGGNASVPPPREPIMVSTPPPTYAPQPQTFTGRMTFSQGCTGNFSVRDARTNREISKGRAFNSGQGLIVLDSAGRQVRALANMGTNTSVLFLPDCNCGQTAGTQSSSLPQPTAHCSAG